MSFRIAICAAQIPFVRGGAEVLYESLRDELQRRIGLGFVDQNAWFAEVGMCPGPVDPR